MYRRHIAIKEIERLGGGIVTEHVGPEWLRSWVDNRRIRSLYKVTSVGLFDSRITDASLVYLNELPEVQAIDLEHTPITDDGLRHLKGLTELRELNLMHTNVTDAGLVHLKGLRNLELLALWKTRVTKTGVREMEDAVPGLRVFW